MPNFETEIINMDQVRMTGVSIMYTERASDLNAQGSIVGAQVNGDKDWTDFITDGFDALTALKQMEVLPAKNGFYTFVKPSTISDLDYEKYSPMKLVNGIQVGTYFDLDSSSSYVAIYAKVQVLGGRDAYLTLAQGYEYLSNNTFREYGMARVRPEVFSDALYELTSVPQFHCNPTHFEEIWNNMKQVAKDIFGGAMYAIPKIKSLLG